MTQVAVIGGGNWGQNLIRTFHQLGALAAIVEPDRDTRDQLAAHYPEVSLYPTLSSVMKSDIPAVVIATPAQTHKDVAMEALSYQKDVFVEKPMTLTGADARELQAAATQADRILMVGHLLLYQPAVQLIRAYLQEGKLGQIYSVQQQRLKLGRVRNFENVLWSFAVHDIALLLDLLGSYPLQVKIAAKSGIQDHIEDDVHLHLQFEGGIQAHLHASWLWPKTVRELTIIGSRGMLMYDEVTQIVTHYRRWIDAELVHHDEGSDVLFQGGEEPLIAECRHFLSCVQERKQPLSHGENGIAVIDVLEQATQLIRAEAK